MLFMQGEVYLNKLKQKDYFIQLGAEFYIQRKHFNFLSYMFVYFMSLLVEPFPRIAFSIAKFEFKAILETISAYRLLFLWTFERKEP